MLTGFEPGDRFHIADAVERELARLLAEKGIPGLDGNSVAMDGLDAGKFKVTGGAARMALAHRQRRLCTANCHPSADGRTVPPQDQKRPESESQFVIWGKDHSDTPVLTTTHV